MIAVVRRQTFIIEGSVFADTLCTGLSDKQCLSDKT